MLFRTGDKEYRAASAVEIVRRLEQDAAGYLRPPGQLREFLRWSLAGWSDSLPTRELDLSDHLGDETLALSYLCLCAEYGLGELLDVPRR